MRCLLSNAKLSKNFWREVAQTASQLINKSLASVIDFKAPNEVWYGKPSNYFHLTIFGCVSYIHVNEEKLQLRSRKYISIGYPEGLRDTNYGAFI